MSQVEKLETATPGEPTLSSVGDTLAVSEHSNAAPSPLQEDGESAPAPVKKRGRGRPKGYPKTGGRQRGTPNRCNAQTRERINELADPIAFMTDVMLGKRMSAAGEPGDAKKTWCYPTVDQRVKAGETLLRKVLPDLKATELSGPDGKPLLEPGELSTLEAARRVAFLLASGADLSARAAPTSGAEPRPRPAGEPPVDEVSEPAAEPAEPPLPPHAHIFLEQGERERSGERCWLVFSGADCLRVFHGAEARQDARAWVGTKFGASPAKEVEVPLPDDEATDLAMGHGGC